MILLRDSCTELSLPQSAVTLRSLPILQHLIIPCCNTVLLSTTPITRDFRGSNKGVIELKTVATYFNRLRILIVCILSFFFSHLFYQFVCFFRVLFCCCHDKEAYLVNKITTASCVDIVI